MLLVGYNLSTSIGVEPNKLQRDLESKLGCRGLLSLTQVQTTLITWPNIDALDRTGPDWFGDG